MTPSQKGMTYGFVASLPIIAFVLLSCDSGCKESPIYLLIPICLIVLPLVGGLIGAIWHMRLLRITILTVVGLLVLVQIVGLVLEMEG